VSWNVVHVVYVADDIPANKVGKASVGGGYTCTYIHDSSLPVTVTVATVVKEVLMGVLCIHKVYIYIYCHGIVLPRFALFKASVTIKMKVDVNNLGIDPRC
jgi:hypothetical protein